MCFKVKMYGLSFVHEAKARRRAEVGDGVEEEVAGRSCVCGRMTLAVSGTSRGSPFPLSSGMWHVLEEPTLK